MTNSLPWGTATGCVRAGAIIGTEGNLVEAVADISNGLAAFCILGLPDATTRETRDRVRAAVLNSGQPWPAPTVTVRLMPHSLPKRGSGFDLGELFGHLAEAVGPDHARVIAGRGLEAGG